jgi:hypothetical protein
MIIVELVFGHDHRLDQHKKRSPLQNRRHIEGL